jgi:hypothetical protein
MPLGAERNWRQEWQELLRWRDLAQARSHEIQAEITAVLRRRQPLPMELMREAERAAGDVAAVKARLRDFLHRLG